MPGVDFTQPYYLAKSGVLLPLDSPTIFSRVKVFFGWAVISSILVLISVLLVVGSLIWLAERRENSEQFPKRWLPGIASGMWFAVVTLTTVGYGDKAPISRTGRGITATWMVISLIAVSSLTASLASAFTLFFSGARETIIRSPAQLQQRRVATIEGTSGVELAERGSMRVLKTENLTSGIELLLSEQAEALIFDRPAIRHHIKLNPHLAVQLAPFTLAEETYGFVFKTGNPLRNPMNVSILRLQRLGEIKSIANKLLN
jgi:polar amino acid transport system substrate-binding protein